MHPADIPVSLVRDYRQINRELARALDDGRSPVRLTDVEGHRLLASGLDGPWRAVVEVVGDAGPELAAGLDAPYLTILCAGSAADGAGLGLRSGRLAILGDAGDAVGAAMGGGAVVVLGSVGHRAGLRQRGGTLVILGSAGRLLSDRQAGGLAFAHRPAIDPADAGRGRSGGRLITLPFDPEPIDPGVSAAYRAALDGLPDPFAAPPLPR